MLTLAPPQVVLVFDAMGSSDRTTMRATNAGEIDVVYCAEQEADSWILAEVWPGGLPFWSSFCRMDRLVDGSVLVGTTGRGPVRFQWTEEDREEIGAGGRI